MFYRPDEELAMGPSTVTNMVLSVNDIILTLDFVLCRHFFIGSIKHVLTSSKVYNCITYSIENDTLRTFENQII
jgi:hypothetical protein